MVFSCDHENLWPKARNTVVYMHRHGNSPGDRIEFKAITTLDPNAVEGDHIELWQRLSGYDPAGYGSSTTYGTAQVSPGLYVYTWHCWASCD